MSIGLALSGGGAKGAAHIGVLQALNEENIKIDYIAGTSSGSIIASLYACGYSPLQILSLFKTYCNYMNDCDKTLPLKLFGTLFTGRLSIKGLAKGNNLECIMKNACMQKNIININQIKMPIAIPTVDINTGEIIYFLNEEIQNKTSKVSQIKPNRKLYDDEPTYKYSGNIASIVRASCSLPGVFEPKVIDNHMLVDGGVRMNTPVSILKEMGADKIIAVTFDNNDKYHRKCSNIVSIAMQSFDIMGHQVNEPEINSADFVIRPKIGEVGMLDCSKTQNIAIAGYKKAKEVIKKIRD